MLLRVTRNDFAFGEVLQITGASRWDLVSFLRAGVVGASVKDTEGPGDHRRFSADDVFGVRLALELKQLGVGSRKQQRFVHQTITNLLAIARGRDAEAARAHPLPCDVVLLTVVRPDGTSVRSARGPWVAGGEVEASTWSREDWDGRARAEVDAPAGLLIQVDRLVAEIEDAIARL